jgi:hypothetical protein
MTWITKMPKTGQVFKPPSCFHDCTNYREERSAVVAVPVKQSSYGR